MLLTCCLRRATWRREERRQWRERTLVPAFRGADASEELDEKLWGIACQWSFTPASEFLMQVQCTSWSIDGHIITA